MKRFGALRHNPREGSTFPARAPPESRAASGEDLYGKLTGAQQSLVQALDLEEVRQEIRDALNAFVLGFGQRRFLGSLQGALIEQLSYVVADEPGQLRVAVWIVRPHTLVVVAQRKIDAEVVLGSGECDVEEPPLLLEGLLVTGRHVARHHPVRRVDDVDDLPLTTLGRVDGRENQVILVEERGPGEIPGRARRVQRPGGGETPAGVVARSDLF